MQTHTPAQSVLPLDRLAPLLRVVPSLPRPLLARLTERMLERLDEIDGDPEMEEDSEDCCAAGDDAVRGGYAPGYIFRTQHTGCEIGDESDAEDRGLSVPL